MKLSQLDFDATNVFPIALHRILFYVIFLFLFCMRRFTSHCGDNFQLFPKVQALKIFVSCKELQSVFIRVYKYCFLSEHFRTFYFSFFKKCVGTMNGLGILGSFLCLWLPAEVEPSQPGADWCAAGDVVSPSQGIFSGTMFSWWELLFLLSWCKPITSGTFCFNVGFLCALTHRNRKIIPSNVVI